MNNTRQSFVNIHRDAWVEINLDNIAKNIKLIKSFLKPETKLLAIVKADAYGHGSVMTVPVMLASGVDMLGVASIDEGLDLRNANINCDILVIGAVPVWAFECAAQNDISISIFSDEHIEACKQAYERTGKKIKAHIKLDTGMNRIGVYKDEAIEFIKKVQNSDFIDLKGIFSHLANGENEELTKAQFDIFDNIISQVDTQNLTIHLLNTVGIYSYPEHQFNMVRAGIGIYGLKPDLPECAKKAEEMKFLPAMYLKGRITRIHTMKKGEGISYGYTYKAQKDIKVATVPIGYADGVPRALSNKIYGSINGKKVKQIGNITMDQMMFDISEVQANEGDVISLLDENLTIDNWANILNTINYELVCRLKVRLPRVYTR